MDDEWRVCIAFGPLHPVQLKSCQKALTSALGSRPGDQVAVSSSRTQIFLYAPSAGSAEEAAQVAREVGASKYIHPGPTVAAADPGRWRVLRPTLRAGRWQPCDHPWL